MKKKIDKCKFCSNCPANTSNESSPYALKAIDLVKEDPEADLSNCCPYYINSKAHGYCFWRYIEYDPDPLQVQTISALLCIPQTIVKSSIESALQKLLNGYNNNVQEIVDFIDIIRSKVRMNANLSDFAELTNDIDLNIKTEEEVVEEPVRKKGRPKKRIPLDMPMHRSGKRTDIYGIYSEKALRRHHGIKKDEKD